MTIKAGVSHVRAGYRVVYEHGLTAAGHTQHAQLRGAPHPICPRVAELVRWMRTSGNGGH
jgi:hypothetical protein